MSGIADALFGSSPSAQSQTTSTISGSQSALQGTLTSILANLLGTGSPYSVPTTPGESSALSALSGYVSPNAAGSGALNQTISSLLGIMSAPPQDWTQYFQNAIAQPLQQTFSQQTLPALQAAFARSAGGTFSGQSDPNTGIASNQPITGFSGGLNFATQDLSNALASNAANAAYSTQQNQVTNALKAAALVPQTTQQPITNLSSILQNLFYPSTLYNTLLSTGGGLANTATQGTNTVVNPGQTGLVPSLLGGIAGNQGFGTALGNFLFNSPT